MQFFRLWNPIWRVPWTTKTNVFSYFVDGNQHYFFYLFCYSFFSRRDMSLFPFSTKFPAFISFLCIRKMFAKKFFDSISGCYVTLLHTYFSMHLQHFTSPLQRTLACKILVCKPIANLSLMSRGCSFKYPVAKFLSLPLFAFIFISFVHTNNGGRRWRWTIVLLLFCFFLFLFEHYKHNVCHDPYHPYWFLI